MLSDFILWTGSGSGPAPPPQPPTRDQMCRVVCSMQGLSIPRPKKVSSGLRALRAQAAAVLEPGLSVDGAVTTSGAPKGWRYALLNAPIEDSFAVRAIGQALDGQALTSDDTIHWWDPMLPTLNASERQAFYIQTKAAGNTHVCLSLGGDYAHPEEGLRSLDYLIPLMREIVAAGLYVLLMCKGDGGGDPNDPPHFDPGALGYPWLMANFAEIVRRIRAAGLFAFVMFCPGFDGVIAAWQPHRRVGLFGLMARAVLGNEGYLAIEPSSGYCVWSGEENDWVTTEGQCFDAILHESPIDMGPPKPIPPQYLEPNGNWKPDPPATNDVRAPYDQIWQMVGRMVKPYHRPAMQPGNDDPGGAPFLLGGGTPRGPYYYPIYETSTYEWIRLDGFPLETVNARRQVFRDLGCETVC